MSFQIVCKRVAAVIFAAFVFTITTSAQMPVVNAPSPTHSMRIAERNNLYCAGFVQKSAIDTRAKIVGAVEEQEKVMFSQNDVMYVSLGSSNGVQVGDVLTVVRPRGQVDTHWTHKDGGLGFYVQEIGALEVVRVKEQVSVVKVKVSCDNFLLGDLVQPTETRSSPVYKYRQPMDLYADPNGKAMGRLFMARDNTDLIYKDNIVYIDLGAEDNVKAGDFLTVFRRLGDGNPYSGDWGESVAARTEGYSSFEYRGGRFSNQASRKSGSEANGKVVTTKKAKEGRPDDLRKVVGEMVILNVKERTATALITRNVQEIHTGDWVEVQ